MIGVAMADVTPPRTADLGDVWAVLCWGSMPHMSVAGAFELRTDGQIQINLQTPNDGWPTGPLLLLMVPASDKPGSDETEAIHHQLARAAGLLSAIETFTLVYESLEDYVLSIMDGLLRPTAVQLYDGLWSHDGSVTDDARHRWMLAANALINHPQRARISLSLEWFDQAKRQHGVDAFLKFWFALETLSMPNDTNVRPMEERLATIYDTDLTTIRARFHVGRLQGLRSEIVHHGRLLRIPAELLDFLHSVYLDLLVDLLGFASPHRAEYSVQVNGPIIGFIQKAEVSGQAMG